MKAAAVNDQLLAEKTELEDSLSKGHDLITEMESKVKKLEAEKKEADRQVTVCNTHLTELFLMS